MATTLTELEPDTDTVLVPTPFHTATLLTLQPLPSTTDPHTFSDLPMAPSIDLQISTTTTPAEKRKSSSRRSSRALGLSQGDIGEQRVPKLRHRSRSGRFIASLISGDPQQAVLQTVGKPSQPSLTQLTSQSPLINTQQSVLYSSNASSICNPNGVEKKESSSSSNDLGTSSDCASQQQTPSSANTTPSMSSSIPYQELEEFPHIKHTSVLSRVKSGKIIKPDIEPLTDSHVDSGSDTELDGDDDDEEDEDDSEDADTFDDGSLPGHVVGNPCRNNGVKLRDLIDAGLIKPPLTIFFKYHETEHKATIIETGEIEVYS